MEDELLKQPADRRLGDNNALPPGPPGAEFDTADFELKSAPPKPPPKEKENSSTERSGRRRSPTGSPPRKRRSNSRGRRSPSSPHNRNRNRRSPSSRRNRFRDYSPPDRRRYGRRSPDRRRYNNRGGMGRDRYRGRGRSSSRSLSRSPTPPRRGGSRWSPKKKPSSPPPPPPPPYGVMTPQLYSDAYGATTGYSQYGVPPPQTGFVQTSEAYVGMQPQTTGFNAAYPPPGSWGVDAYGQQQWMAPPPAQMRQMPPPQQQTPQQSQPQPPTTTSPVAVTPAAPTAPAVVATTVPPPPTLTNPIHILPDAAPGTVEANPQHDAVAQEAENQRDELKKQRTSYLKKTSVLKKELKMLKEQRKDLHSGKAPASPTTKGFIDENEKLQNQIQKKLSTIENVIDMLTGIIGEENIDKDDEPGEERDAAGQVLKDSATAKSTTGSTSGSAQKPPDNKERGVDKKKPCSSSSSDESSSDSTSSSSDSSSSSENEAPPNKPEDDDDSSPERLKKKVIESMKNKEKETTRSKTEAKVPTKKERFNYVFYDPEMHWCQTCNIFPKTAKDYLNHLHSKDHMDRESIETPWHTDMVSDQFPTHENVPTKRTPIRGLTFFVPATAWFCKLCNIWMGDLHCASTHLKSQLHASKYNSFLEENPHYEVNWLADRQKVLNDQKLNPLPQQITSVSTTAADRKKSKKDDEKVNKKRKKKSDKKQKKKKKKSNKKRKKGESDTSDSSSSDSSSSSETDEPKKKKLPAAAVEIKDLDNPNPAGVSIRLSMSRKQEATKPGDVEMLQAPPPPQLKVSQQTLPIGGKWTVVQEGVKLRGKEDDQEDDGIMQEWNTVQPVISESEKKLLEQLKGKLKNKSNPNDQQSSKSGGSSTSNTPAISGPRTEVEKENRSRDRSDRRDNRNSRDNRENRDRRTARRTLSRSPTRSRSRGRDYRRHMRRSRSPSRGRGGWRGRRRNDRSRSRSMRRRSRSYDRRRRNTRSRTRSASRGRVEKPIVRQPEFRPRVPEKDKEKEKKASENKEKKEKQKSKLATTAAATAANSKVKLPFIGKMPVFKKQSSGQQGENEKRLDEQQLAAGYMYPMDASAYTTQRPPAPTAAQIQMAMMEDAYGNAPPFHPDAGMMMDYDDLMPDPVQFVNIMGQAPPPPPPQASDDKDMLPPGIDEEESEEFLSKPTVEAPPPPPPGKGELPQDLEDALNIIFPGEKKPGEEEDEEKSKVSKGETQIINDEPKFQPEELAKDGIHLVTLEETSQLGLDEASQMSMNEPLVFNRPTPSNGTTTLTVTADMDIEDSNSRNTLERNDTSSPLQQEMTEVEVIPPEVEKEIFVNTELPNPKELDDEKAIDESEQPRQSEIIAEEIEIPIPESMPTIPESIPIPEDSSIPIPESIPIPSEPELTLAPQPTETELDASPKEVANIVEITTEIDLADIPQPPASPTESEKNRRQEELDDLAMLGIDADDMAAQCM